MLKTKIAVLVSGGGTNLQALIDAQKSGTIQSGQIVLVASNNPNAYALTRAEENGINKMALIMVGGFLGSEYERSKLYDPAFTHLFREASK